MYIGNRLTCKECKHVSRSNIIDGKMIWSPCKMIDHDIIQLYPKVFGGYSESVSHCEICYYYERATWIKNSEFTTIEDYIEFMDDWYNTPATWINKDINYIRHCQHISLIIGDKWIEVALFDWLNNTWNTNEGIKYIRLYDIVRSPKGTIKRKIRIDSLELGEFGYYRI